MVPPMVASIVAGWALAQAAPNPTRAYGCPEVQIFVTLPARFVPRDPADAGFQNVMRRVQALNPTLAEEMSAWKASGLEFDVIDGEDSVEDGALDRISMEAIPMRTEDFARLGEITRALARRLPFAEGPEFSTAELGRARATRITGVVRVPRQGESPVTQALTQLVFRRDQYAIVATFLCDPGAVIERRPRFETWIRRAEWL